MTSTRSSSNLNEFSCLLAEIDQSFAEQATLELQEKREQLQREVIPLQAADISQKYNTGKRKPNKRDVPGLAADNARLRQELEYCIKDQQDVFQLHQKTERERQELQEVAKTLSYESKRRINFGKRWQPPRKESRQSALHLSNRQEPVGANKTE